MSDNKAKPDPLAALIVDGENLDKEQIVSALAGVAGLNKTGEVVQLSRFRALTARQKILSYLLAYKAAEILQLRTDSSAGGADLARSTGLAEGTVYPTITQLRGDRVISQDSKSRYFIAHHQVAAASAEVMSEPSTPTRSRSGARKNASQRATSKRPAKTDGGETSATETTKEAPASRTKRASSADFKPSEAVKAMILEGYFDTPKGLGDVRKHLKDVHARDVPVTTLSPIFTRILRSGKLKRSKNAQGNYEYFVPRTSR